MKFLVFTLTALVFTSGAYAAKCSNVSFTVKNNLNPTGVDGRDIEVVDMEYYDYEDEKWRNEVTGNKTIAFGDSQSWTKDLTWVGGENIKIKIQYFEYVGGKKSGEKKSAKGEKKKCVDGMNYGTIKVD